MTVEDILGYFEHEGPTEEQQQEADKFQPVYFLAANTSGIARCTRCQQDISINAARHLDHIACPNCRYPGTVIQKWRYRGKYIDKLRRNVLTYHLEKSPINPDAVLCKAVYSMYEVVKDKDELHTTRFIDAWYVFIPGEGGHEATWNRRWYPQFDSYLKRDWRSVERARSAKVPKRCTGRHKVYEARNLAETKLQVEGVGKNKWLEVTKGQQLQYVCGFYADALANEYDFVELMDRIAKWPLAMEQMGKVGFRPMLLKAIFYGYAIGGIFNMRGKNLEAMLRIKLSKKDMAYMQRESESVSLQSYQRWTRVKKSKYGKDLSLEEFMGIAYKGYNETMLREALDHAPLQRIIDYLNKQNAKFPESENDLGLYSDYIEDCIKLNIELNTKAVLFPNNLNQMHTNLNAQIQYKANEKLEIEYQKRYEKLLDSYSYRDDTYSIVVPDRVSDLIREGKVQHICVGMYVNRVAKGKTDVVYIRKNNAMDTSFCTMEITDGVIIQVRAKRNEKPPEDTMEFVEKFRREKLEKGA